MGKSTTPTFRIELKMNGNFNTSFVFDTKEHGRPTIGNAEKYRNGMNNSLKEGGTNYHITERQGFYKPYTDARIINQKTKEIVIEFKAPMFEVI